MLAQQSLAFLETDRFLCAVEDEPWFVRVPLTGEPDDDLQRLLVGRPLFPRLAATGAIAYLAQMDVDDASWLRVVAFGTPEEGVVDVLPSVVPYAPPAWSPSGDRLALIRGRPDSPVQRVVSYDVRRGAEEVLVEDEGIRSVAWAEERELVYTTVSKVIRLRLDRAGREDLLEHRVAAAFARFGTDDLYVSLDQVAVSREGRLALVLRWCHQGKPYWEEPRLVVDGELRGFRGCPTGRSPRWSVDGRLGISVGDAIVIVEEGSVAVSIPIAGLHSMDWLQPTAPKREPHSTGGD